MGGDFASAAIHARTRALRALASPRSRGRHGGQRTNWAWGRCISRPDFGEELFLQVAEEAHLAFLRRDVLDRLLQREHRLRALQRIETQAPVDHFENVVRVLARPNLLRRY